MDPCDNPIENIPVSEIVIHCTGGGNTITCPDEPTDENGQTTAKITSTTAETKTVSATVLGGLLSDTAVVEFGQPYFGPDWYVDAANTGYGNGSPTYPFRTISEAIIAAQNNHTIIVAQGTYYENIDYDAKAITICCTDPNDPSIVQTTIINGIDNTAVVSFGSYENPNSVISGFTVTGGNGSYGGGIYCKGSPTIINNIITGNVAGYGGGIYCSSSSYSPTIHNNTIVYNLANYGAGLYNCHGSIANCLIINNATISSYGNGAGLNNCDGDIVLCTIAANDANDDGGGMYSCNGTIRDCIIWNNTAGDQGNQLQSCSTPTYSCVQGGCAGQGCLDSDPLFADPSSDDYHLLSEAGRWDPALSDWVLDGATSLCVDTADPSSDFSNEPLPNGARANMGAYGNTIYASKSVPKGYIEVEPDKDFVGSGSQGGPFDPNQKVYTLKNAGDLPVNYTVTKANPANTWYDVNGTDSVSGSLEPNQVVAITTSLNNNAKMLPLGTHTDSVIFTNTTNGIGNTQRDVQLAIGVITIGTGTGQWDYPLHTYYHDSRTQVIYLAGELGSAKNLTSLALDVTTLPGQTLNYWTIRMKHTSLSDYSSNTDWQNGFTTVYQNNEVISSTGWVTFEFDNPFEYNGSDNLLIDFSHNNSSYTSNGNCHYSTPGGLRSIYFCTDSGYGDPLTWTGSSPSANTSTNVPNLKLIFGAPVAMSITPSDDFSSAGPMGGPFEPPEKIYTLENQSSETINYSVTKAANQPWYDINDTSTTPGSLEPDGTADIIIYLNSAAEALSRGTYQDSVIFSDLTNTRDETRNVALSVWSSQLQGTWVSCTGSDQTGDGSGQNPYRTIQHAISVIADGGTIIVTPGRYVENVLFALRDLILQSVDPQNPSVVASTIIDGNNFGLAVNNNIITNNILEVGSGGGVFYSLAPYDIFLYNDVYGNIPQNYAGDIPDKTGTEGNVSADPLYANSGQWSGDSWSNGDYHLKSARGRWDPVLNQWVTDVVTGSCIDGGDPIYFWAELWPHGKCLNMGGYGGTPQASMSPIWIIAGL